MATGTKLNTTLKAFIDRQHVFFVATADTDGRVNMSPKGMDTLQIRGDNQISWLNLSGSGNETAAHVQATGRMTLMFCAFDGDPLILRVYGTASVIHPKDAGWDEVSSAFPAMAGRRQVFDLKVDMVQTSCGTGVPVMAFTESRGEEQLLPFYDNMGVDGVKEYWGRKNVTTIDGKPTGIFE